MSKDELSGIRHSSFNEFVIHSQVLSPTLLIRAAEDQLNLLGPIIVRPQQHLNRCLHLRAPAVRLGISLGPVDSVECRGHFQQFRPNRQKLLLKDIARSLRD